MGTERILLHLPDGSRRPIDPDEVYLLETAEGDTWVRLRSRQRLRDARRIGDLVEVLAPHGFVWKASWNSSAR